MANKQYAWSVRGVTRDARDQVKIAARERGVTTGEWISLAMVTIADQELMVSPKSLLPIGPSPIASSVDETTIEKLGPRERALLALASKRPAPKSRAEQEQQSPWSIRGVSQEARLKAAKIAAHRRVTIGEWVNHAIMVYAHYETGSEPAPKAQDQIFEPVTDIPEKTMRLVETLARHFNDSGTPDSPQAPTEAALRDVEIINQARSSDAVSHSPSAAPPAPQAGASESGGTDHKITALADQVRDTELINEKRISALTRVLSAVADRLQSAGENNQRDEADPEFKPEPNAASLSRAEMMFWESIKDSGDPDAYISYLESFPNGLFASLARRRASRESESDIGDVQPIDEAVSRPPRRRPPPLSSIPKFDYDVLNERAIENTKRRN